MSIHDKSVTFIFTWDSNSDTNQWLLDSILELSKKSEAFQCIALCKNQLQELHLLELIAHQGLSNHIKITSTLQRFEFNSDLSVAIALNANDVFPLDNEYSRSLNLPIIAINSHIIAKIIRDNINGYIVTKSEPQSLLNSLLKIVFNNQILQKMKQFMTQLNSQWVKTESATISPTVNEHVKPLVSIIIPCYNHEKFIIQTLYSVISQTYDHWECIVVNDGSTDNSSSLIQNFINDHSKFSIKLVSKENGGSSSARNCAVANSRGEWILPLDGDDLLAPIALEVFIKKALEFSCDIVFPNTQVFGHQVFTSIQGPFDIKLLMQANRLPYCSLYHRRVYDAVGGYNENQYSYEDWNFWIGAAKLGFKGVSADHILFFYRTLNKSKYTMALKNHDKIVSQIIENHAELYPAEIVSNAKAYLKEHGYYNSILYRKKMEQQR